MIWLWILGIFVILLFFILLPPLAPFTVFKQAEMGEGLGGGGRRVIPHMPPGMNWGRGQNNEPTVCCAVRFSSGNPDFTCSTGDKVLLTAYCSFIPAFHHIQSIWERPQVQILNNVFYLGVISSNKFLTPDLIYLHFLFQIGTSTVFNGSFVWLWREGLNLKRKADMCHCSLIIAVAFSLKHNREISFKRVWRFGEKCSSQ